MVDLSKSFPYLYLFYSILDLKSTVWKVSEKSNMGSVNLNWNGSLDETLYMKSLPPLWGKRQCAIYLKYIAFLMID